MIDDLGLARLRIRSNRGRDDPQAEDCGIRRGQVRTGSHLLLKHPTSGQEVWVAVHTKKDAGRSVNSMSVGGGKVEGFPGQPCSGTLEKR